ncbi:MAG TPA: SDR family oxidoreductase [Azospirillaceae bacterium]|nr:SDR family oxidoreductase [Azospirillaceae bacterium]
MDLGLKGKRAIVTGASRGIGLSIAETLAGEGASVAICARGADGVAQAVERLRAKGVAAHGEAVDIRDADAFKAAMARMTEALGGLDVLVSNVSTRIHTKGEDLYRDTFEADFLQHVRTIDLAMPALRDSKGSIVVVASIASVLTQLPPGEEAYGTMKAALINHCGQLANRNAAAGVRVNAVSPGPVLFEGGFWAMVRDKNPALFASAQRLPAMGRLAAPEEIANAVAFLASPAAAYITGANLRIDGGALKSANF